MLGRLIILFITIPLVELYLLAVVGSRVGLLPTIMLVILTGAWGAYLAKSQGYSILARIQAETAAGRVPTAELIDGLLVLIGGIPEEILAFVAVAGTACYRAGKGKGRDFNSHNYPTAATNRGGHSAGIWSGDLNR